MLKCGVWLIFKFKRWMNYTIRVFRRFIEMLEFRWINFGNEISDFYRFVNVLSVGIYIFDKVVQLRKTHHRINISVSDFWSWEQITFSFLNQSCKVYTLWCKCKFSLYNFNAIKLKNMTYGCYKCTHNFWYLTAICFNNPGNVLNLADHKFLFVYYSIYFSWY